MARIHTVSQLDPETGQMVTVEVPFTPSEEAARDAEEAAWLPARIKRTLKAIYDDLLGLTGAQKTAVWADLVSGSPPKILASTGPASDSIFLMWRIASNASLPPAMILDGKLTAAAFYVRDKPAYLVNPAFDPSINVAGDVAS